jgi:hypothetical protein
MGKTKFCWAKTNHTWHANHKPQQLQKAHIISLNLRVNVGDVQGAAGAASAREMRAGTDVRVGEGGRELVEVESWVECGIWAGMWNEMQGVGGRFRVGMRGDRNSVVYHK